MVVNSISFKLQRFLRTLLDLLASFIGLLYPSKKRYLPPISNRLLLEPAIEISDKIKSGKVSVEKSIHLLFAFASYHINAWLLLIYFIWCQMFFIFYDLWLR